MQALSHDAVDVWCLPLSVLPADLTSLAALLDAEEHARAARFLHKEEASAFIVAHAAARILLARYLNAAPQILRYGYALKGKPYLLEPVGPAPLYFNFARTRGFAVFAFTRCGEVGVDVERIADSPPAEIIRRALSPAEQHLLSALDPTRADAVFFALWARKEAVLKTRGDGLSVPPAEIEVHDIQAIRLRGALQPQYALQDIVAAAGYAAALCVEIMPPQEMPEIRIGELSALALCHRDFNCGTHP